MCLSLMKKISLYLWSKKKNIYIFSICKMRQYISLYFMFIPILIVFC